MTSEKATEEGPNGIPYADDEMTRMGKWENGEFFFQLYRTDGEKVSVNLTEAQLRTFKQQAEEMLNE